jgi:restriction system protein
MGVPDYQSMMLPALSRLADGREHGLRDLLGQVADDLELSESDRTEPLASGNGTKLYSRLQWAFTYMAQARLLDKVGRGLYKITQRGLDHLASRPTRIDNGVLRGYPEFVAFLTRSRTVGTDEVAAEHAAAVSEVAAASDPDTMIDQAARTIREQIVSELTDRVKGLPPTEFEILAIQLLEAIGYGHGRVTGGSGDRGIDGILEGDALGLDRVYVQCKRFSSANVGGGDLRNFIGALHQHRANRGVFMTTATFTDEALTSAQSSTYSIALLDGRRIAELMYDYDVGVVPDRTVVLKRIDEGRFIAQ